MREIDFGNEMNFNKNQMAHAKTDQFDEYR